MMFILPNFEECLDENGKISESKLNKEFMQLRNLLLESEAKNSISSLDKFHKVPSFEECIDENGDFSQEKFNTIISDK